MNALPERRPTAQPYQAGHHPTPIHPTTVETYSERQPVKWVQSAIDPSQSVAVPAHLVIATPAPEPRNLDPQPLIDPIAQRIAASGVLAAGVGVGGWLLFSALAGATVALGFLFGALLLAKLPAPSRGGNTTIHVHQRAGMFGRNHNTNR